MKDFKRFYEGYHRNRQLPKRVIGERDFTYRHIVSVLNRFCRDKDVLDVGSGVGTLDFYLAAKGKRVTGIEISERALGVARKSLEIFNLKDEINFILGDFFKLNPKKAFDLVMCSEVLEHLKNDKAAIKKIYNLTKKGGLAMVTVPSSNAPLIKFGAIKAFDARSGHLRRYTLNSLKSLLAANKFKVIYSEKTEGILRNLLFVFRLDLIIRIANKFPIVSDIITWFDDITLRLWGESQIIVVVKK